MSDWKEVNTGLVDRFISLEVGQTITGIHEQKLVITGSFGESTVWVLRQPDGTRLGINSRAQLDRLMAAVPEGFEVRIQRGPDRTNPKTGRVYQTFSVWCRKVEVVDDDIPF
mgnify:CR=1 FL=1